MGIFTFQILTVGTSIGSNCVIVPDFVAIGQTLPIYRDICIFKMAAAAILYFQKFYFLSVGTVEKVELRHNAKFR